MRWLSLAFVLSACGNPGKAFNYPLDSKLRYDHLQVKGTHNSYHVETTELPEWDYTHAPLDVQLDRQGVRQIELDINWLHDETGEGMHFEVYHVVAADEGTTCRLLQDCLRTIRDWSDRYPGHLPIYIQLEPKHGFAVETAEAFFRDLENDILAVFARARILTPDELQGSSSTLPAALAGGWPTLDHLRGRVLFNLDNRSEPRTAYTHQLSDLHGRLSFVDSDPAEPFGAISILNDPAGPIAAALAAHFLVRTRGDADGQQFRANDMSMFQAALSSGAHFISTDFPAPVGGGSYFLQMPDGTPARCNPITAPAECTSLALEDPRFVGSGQ